jgi:hypothetical protein
MTISLRIGVPIMIAALAACGGGNGSGDGPLSTTAVTDREINLNTSDTALPVPINGSDIADNDQSDSALPMSL